MPSYLFKGSHVTVSLDYLLSASLNLFSFNVFCFKRTRDEIRDVRLFIGAGVHLCTTVLVFYDARPLFSENQ